MPTANRIENQKVELTLKAPTSAIPTRKIYGIKKKNNLICATTFSPQLSLNVFPDFLIAPTTPSFSIAIIGTTKYVSNPQLISARPKNTFVPMFLYFLSKSFKIVPIIAEIAAHMIILKMFEVARASDPPTVGFSPLTTLYTERASALSKYTTRV